MMLSLSLLLLTGLLFGWGCRKVHLPSVPGYLLAGIVLGPQVSNLLSSDLLSIGSDLREIALIIILAKAGLSLDSAVLKRIGRPAALLCFLPATCEILAFVFLAPMVLGCPHGSSDGCGIACGSSAGDEPHDGRTIRNG